MHTLLGFALGIVATSLLFFEYFNREVPAFMLIIVILFCALYSIIKEDENRKKYETD